MTKTGNGFDTCSRYFDRSESLSVDYKQKQRTIVSIEKNIFQNYIFGSFLVFWTGFSMVQTP